MLRQPRQAARIGNVVQPVWRRLANSGWRPVLRSDDGAGRLRPRFQQRGFGAEGGGSRRSYVRAIATAEQTAPTGVGSGDLLGGDCGSTDNFCRIRFEIAASDTAVALNVAMLPSRCLDVA